jgi:DNA-binding transcriptional regulator YhcF (GntR family)
LTDPVLGPQSVPRAGRQRPVARRAILAVAVAGLSLHMNPEGESCYPGVETLAEETGLSRRTVQRVLRVLERGGWLEVVRGGGRGRSSRYRARIPSRPRAVLDEAAKGAAAAALDAIERKGVTVTPFSERATLGTLKGVTVTPEVFSRSPEEELARPLGSLAEHRARRGLPVIDLQVAPDTSKGLELPVEPEPLVADGATPVWTWVWWWARARGERRTFPQLAASPGDVGLPFAEYERLELEWRAEGSPQEFDPRVLVDTQMNLFGREV